MIEKLNNLDRRWIFLVITLAVALPLLIPLGLPVEISKPTQKFYDTIESLPSDSLVCMSFDYGPGTKVECHPMALATLSHLFKRGCKVVAIALWPEGALYAREALNEIAREQGKIEGQDYVNLGYKAGGEVVLRGAGDDFQQIFTGDIDGHAWAELPLLKRVKGWKSFDLVCDWSMGKPGLLEYVRVVSSQYGRPLVTGTTAVTTPEAYPYLNSGQVLGILQGLRGASEYEHLVDRPDSATRGMDAQSVAHFTIAALIVLANVSYWLGRRRQKGN